MKYDRFVVQSSATPPQQSLFHGVGDNPVAMGESGSWFAPLFPDAPVAAGGDATLDHPGYTVPKHYLSPARTM